MCSKHIKEVKKMLCSGCSDEVVRILFLTTNAAESALCPAT